ncbi:uncharacterized protein [Panulirus ornatus]|uniref:uncharacterized protein n=1 Tax=Panulirus ornatus TaxID=150431 RepID=UPI003A88301E
MLASGCHGWQCWSRLVLATMVVHGVLGGPSGALPSLGALGPGGGPPLDAVVGPRLMSRLVETEAVQRVVAAAERECCGLVDPTTTPLTRHWLTRHPHASPHAYHQPHAASHTRHQPHAASHARDHRAVCNDNSPAGFYFRRSQKSRRWIVFLEGGWYCFDSESCEQRWRRLRPLMTSREWPETRHVGGVLSPHPEENPYWWTANHVFVPYCSSDSWSGTHRAADGSGEFSFMGSVIVEEVVKALITLNFTHGHKLILAGSSAGGVGVLVNVDHVARQLADLGIQAEVRAVSDSGWFLDNEPFAPLKCVDAHSCPPVEAIRRGQKLWQGRIPDLCREEYPQHPWYCYFGYRVYPSLKSPLFVFQWVFDEAQMTADNVGKPTSKEQWDYIHGIGERLRKTFENVTALFAPSCISHTVLTKRNWASIKIGEVSLPQALYCWDTTPSIALTAKTFNDRRNNVSGVDGSVEVQTIVRHHHQLHHAKSKGERRKQGEANTTQRRTKNNSQGGRRRHGRRRGKKSRRKLQVMSEELSNDDNQSSHLVLLSTHQRGNSSDNSSDVTNVDRTINGPKPESPVNINHGIDTEQSQEINKQNILSGEMLADSPKNSVQISSEAGSANLVESNSIGIPQENVQIRHRKQGSKRPNWSDSETSRKGRRRKRKRKKNKGKKQRERKQRKRERRRQRRERRRKRLEKKKRRGRKRGIVCFTFIFFIIDMSFI